MASRCGDQKRLRRRATKAAMRPAATSATEAGFPALLILILVFQSSGLVADPVPVRHIEGVTLGFLVLRNLSGEALAYGDLKQVVQDDGLVLSRAERCTRCTSSVVIALIRRQWRLLGGPM